MFSLARLPLGLLTCMCYAYPSFHDCTRQQVWVKGFAISTDSLEFLCMVFFNLSIAPVQMHSECEANTGVFG